MPPSALQRTGIALGSNLGSRLDHLRAARDLLLALASPGTLRQAPVFRTAPVACPDGSPDFFNTVVEFGYSGGPLELLAATRDMEKALGRRPAVVRNAPRVIDIDLLYVGDHTLGSPELELPHPRLTLRRFVLEPLAALSPDLLLPGHSLTVAEHLARLDSSEPPLVRVTDIW